MAFMINKILKLGHSFFPNCFMNIFVIVFPIHNRGNRKVQRERQKCFKIIILGITELNDVLAWKGRTWEEILKSEICELKSSEK